MKLLVELSGPASSGKTTVAKQLVEDLKGEYNICFLKESIRDMPDVDFERCNTDQFYAKNFQERIYYMQFGKIIQAMEHFDIIICDRSLCDYALYAEIYIDDRYYVETHRNRLYQFYKRIKGAHKIIKLKDVPLEDDGFRNMKIRDIEVDKFDVWNMPNSVRVNTKNHDERIIEITKIVEDEYAHINKST